MSKKESCPEFGSILTCPDNGSNGQISSYDRIRRPLFGNAERTKGCRPLSARLGRPPQRPAQLGGQGRSWGTPDRPDRVLLVCLSLRARSRRVVRAIDSECAVSQGKTSGQGGSLGVTTVSDDSRRKLLAAAFRMPSMQTMVSRKSSITNAFVNAIIPTVLPSPDEVEEALGILGMDPADVRCAYCGDKSTEWDHLRPLVVKRRPTGYITEIANLVPACGKCNQSKGNKPWRDWILSSAKLSPTGRGVPNVADRVSRLEAYERWRSPTKVDFQSILGQETWEHYWSLCEAVNEELRQNQQVADSIRARIVDELSRK